MKYERQYIQEVFIRVAKDSGFGLEGTRVALFVANLLDMPPFMVYTAMGDMDTMNKISKGDHPVCKE